jgi:hypothetical protein
MRARADFILDEHEFLKGPPADFGFQASLPRFQFKQRAKKPNQDSAE